MTTVTTSPTASSESTPVTTNDQIVLSELDRSCLQASCARSTLPRPRPVSTSNSSLLSPQGWRFGRYCWWIERRGGGSE